MDTVEQISRSISTIKQEVSEILTALADNNKLGDELVAEAVVNLENDADLVDLRFRRNSHVVEYYASL